jgi:hypothetical protein
MPVVDALTSFLKKDFQDTAKVFDQIKVTFKYMLFAETFLV